MNGFMRFMTNIMRWALGVIAGSFLGLCLFPEMFILSLLVI
jgi:hypothetical protein